MIGTENKCRYCGHPIYMNLSSIWVHYQGGTQWCDVRTAPVVGGEPVASVDPDRCSHLQGLIKCCDEQEITLENTYYKCIGCPLEFVLRRNP